MEKVNAPTVSVFAIIPSATAMFFAKPDFLRAVTVFGVEILFAAPINYIQVGDYYIPEIALPEAPKTIGKWERFDQNHLKNHHSVRYNPLIVTEQL